MAITGHCLCRAVTYSIDAEKPNVVAYDHCDDCQRFTGSTYGTCSHTIHHPSLTILTHISALSVIFPKDKFTIKGPTKTFISKGGSGLDVCRTFCSECGSGIVQAPNAAPDIIAVTGGSLNNEVKKKLKPVCILISTRPGS